MITSYKNLSLYYKIIKPGIVYSNLFTAVAGFYLASLGVFSALEFTISMLALMFILASSTVFNNYIDQDIDKVMSRTKNRTDIFATLTAKNVFIFAIILAIIGFTIQALFVNILTFFITIFGYFVYIVIYTMWLKRSSVYSTVIGSLSGAVPPLAGYTSFSNAITLESLLLFTILIAWQMPHFFAIGVYRIKDYTAINVPILPVKYGFKKTKVHMFWWTVFLIFLTFLLYFFTNLGIYFLIFCILSGIIKLLFFINFSKYLNFDEYNLKWAKKVFWYSIVDITLLCILIILNA